MGNIRRMLKMLSIKPKDNKMKDLAISNYIAVVLTIQGYRL